jgi:hypothetical protein
MIKIILAIMALAMVGCSTIGNDQSACVTDCNIGSSGYTGLGGDVHNDQSACTNDCNIGGSNRVYSIPAPVHWSANTVYYPYNLQYRRGPMVIYHY